MNANTLKELIMNYSAQEEEIYDQAVERLINKIRDELNGCYDRGEWYKFIGCTQLGISLEKVDGNFKNFEFHTWGILKGETIEEDYDMLRFEEFFAENEETISAYSCSGYDGKDIITELQPFVKALRRSLFDVYYDEDNCCMVIAFNVKG